ncbi:sterol desaturase family protein [Novosphingobium sp.]|uniref:sterol desaturase family protein n=1 Tax=Novosphingobium sp. TaxID=1874826 RepID=UPI003B516DA6
MKAILFSLVQPAFIAVIIAFWWLAPPAWVNNPNAILFAVIATTALIQALEWVKERHIGWRMTRQEFFTDVFYVVLGFTAIDFLTSHLAEDPLKAFKVALGLGTPWIAHLPFVAQVALVIFLVEFGQYWMHRGMHNFTPLWLVHAPHHHITQLNTMKGAVGNPIELFLISLSVIALLDVPLTAVLCAANIGVAVSSFAHANVRLDPPRWYAFVFTTIRHHSLHHSVPYEDTRCNYANSLIVIDRMFGTFRNGEAEVVGQDERKRLSIREQWLFPAMPVIAMVKARRVQPAAGSV